MIITCPKPDNVNVNEGDLIALTKNETFIGYGFIMATLEDTILIDIDKKTEKTFRELFMEDIPFSFDIF